MITDKQYQYIINKIPYVKEEDLQNITKEEASQIIKRNIIENRPLLQTYGWRDKKTNEKYCCTIHSNKQECFEDDNIEIYNKVYLKKRQAEEHWNTQLQFRSPCYMYREKEGE